MKQNFDTTQTYLLVHQQSQLALEAPNQTNYTKNSLELGPINENNPNQMWIVEHKGKDRYEIILGFPDVVLTADGRDVYMKKGVGDKSKQYWVFDGSTMGQLRIIQAKKDKHYLGVENHHIVIKTNPPIQLCDTWEFRPVTKNKELNRCCYIRCMRTNKLMDVPASQGNEGVQICLWDANYRFNQRWKIYRAGEVCIIKSFKTDLNLDIEGEDYNDGTHVIQWHSTGGYNQFWMFEKKGISAYRISSWIDPGLEIGHDGKRLIIHRGQKFTWKIEGHLPEI